MKILVTASLVQTLMFSGPIMHLFLRISEGKLEDLMLVLGPVLGIVIVVGINRLVQMLLIPKESDSTGYENIEMGEEYVERFYRILENK